MTKPKRAKLRWSYDKDDEMWYLHAETSDESWIIRDFGKWQAKDIAGRRIPKLPKRRKKCVT